MSNNQRLLIRALRGRAGVFNLVGENENALQDAQKGLTLSRKIGDTNLIIHGLLITSQCYFSMSRYNRAKRIVEKALLLSEKSREKNAQADCFNRLGNIFLEQEII